MNHVTFFKIRKALALTQAELGALLGMSSVNIHYIEKGESKLSGHHKAILRDELGIDEQRTQELIEQYDEINNLAGDRERALHKIKR